MGCGPTNPPQNSLNDHLTNTTTWKRDLRISVAHNTKNSLEPVHHKKVRLVLGTFAVCRTENVLHEAGIFPLAEIREQDTARIAKRVITNESHPKRSYFMISKIHDKYEKSNQYLLEHIYWKFGSTTYRREENRNRGGRTDTNKSTNPYAQSQRAKGSSIIRFRAETAKILEEKYNEHIKIHTDGSKKDEKVGCAVITADQKCRHRLKPQNTVYSAEQEAIIKAIYVTKTKRTGEWRSYWTPLAHSWQ
jgi:hypothetical protein